MPYVRLTDEEVAARKRRNLALAGGLVVFIVLVFTVTVLNLHRNVSDREAQVAATPQGVAASQPHRTPETAS